MDTMTCTDTITIYPRWKITILFQHTIENVLMKHFKFSSNLSTTYSYKL